VCVTSVPAMLASLLMPCRACSFVNVAGVQSCDFCDGPLACTAHCAVPSAGEAKTQSTHPNLRMLIEDLHGGVRSAVRALDHMERSRARIPPVVDTVPSSAAAPRAAKRSRPVSSQDTPRTAIELPVRKSRTVSGVSVSSSEPCTDGTVAIARMESRPRRDRPPIFCEVVDEQRGIRQLAGPIGHRWMTLAYYPKVMQVKCLDDGGAGGREKSSFICVGASRADWDTLCSSVTANELDVAVCELQRRSKEGRAGRKLIIL